jgi:hypothetical protein
MKAEVTKEFRGTPDNATSERGIAVGEIIFGEFAKAAVKAGNAKEASDKPAKGKAKD